MHLISIKNSSTGRWDLNCNKNEDNTPYLPYILLRATIIAPSLYKSSKPNDQRAALEEESGPEKTGVHRNHEDKKYYKKQHQR